MPLLRTGSTLFSGVYYWYVPWICSWQHLDTSDGVWYTTSRSVFMQSDWWIEKGDFRSETKPGVLTTQSKKCFRSQLFRSSNAIGASRRKSRHFEGMRGSDCSIEKVFEAHRISHHPTNHTITPYNSYDAGLTAAAAAAAAHSGSAWHILFSARQQRVPSSMAAVRDIDYLFATPLLLLCSLWRLSTKFKSTTATMKRTRAPHAPNEHFACGKGATKTRA